MNLSLLLENLKTRFDQKRFKATANKRRHCELLTPKCINVELSLSERETRLREFCSARHVLFLLVILYFWADLYGFGLPRFGLRCIICSRFHGACVLGYAHVHLH